MKQFKPEDIEKAKERFAELIKGEENRISRMEESGEPVDFEKLDQIIVGVMPGDGIGPILMPLALKVMKELVGEEMESGKILIKEIEGMTIENRVAQMNSLPEECLEEIKKCHVLLKGPMPTPRPGDGLPHLVSANSMLRRSRDLYAAERPIDIKD
ncbi:MAG: isocitrate/isopropylmalate dehydrogenase family protein, partial [Clostridiales bacterium]|nr:isocitrate/isopropylmalate dehydrogenase family protein [Clostridiales bacterium]